MKAVEKPGRYLGMEINSIHKNWDENGFRVLLVYPDIYEIGMSNQGLEILYNIINARTGCLAERAYAPGMDLEKILREERHELFSLESRHPIKDFDIIGFTLQYELLYTNILNMLQLGNIPLRGCERRGGYPLIIAGGPCTCNPEPLADFMDAFLIGDGEEAILELIEACMKNIHGSRDELLVELSQIEGVYVPSLYGVTYNTDGTLAGFAPVRAGIKKKISKVTASIDRKDFVLKPLVGLIDTVHKRLTLEIQRGCGNNCRFCQARSYYYPLRVRDKDFLLRMTEEGLKYSGYDEISLSSLSSMDYPGIDVLVDEIHEKYSKKGISISLSSLRPDRFSMGLAKKIGLCGKTGLTFAIESGSERLRGVLNKHFDEGAVISGIQSAYTEGWRHVKLYFMIGLPTEEPRDIEEIVSMVERIRKACRGMELNISVSNFIPKPHTAFQWFAQEPVGILKEKQEYLKNNLKGRLRFHNAEASFIEAVFSRGDRRTGLVLERAHKLGCRFDQWSEHFKFELWEQAFSAEKLSMGFYANRPIDTGELLAWDHIECGIKKAVLLKEYADV